MLSSLRTELQYRLTPVGDAIARLSTRQELKELTFLSACRERCTSGEPFPEAWAHAIKDRVLTSPLSESDVGLLDSLGSGLGTTDLAGQISLCNLHDALLNEHLTQARAVKERYGKLYASLGLLAGLAAAILLW